jgi:hypothetical protein
LLFAIFCGDTIQEIDRVMKFLCSTHQQQLKRCTMVAGNRWDKWMEASREAFAQRNWHTTQYFGCSLELSEMLLESDD